MPRPSLKDTKAAKKQDTKKSKQPDTNDDKRRGQTLRLKEDAWKQLKFMSVEEGRTSHDLLIEAVNDLFQKYGKPPLA